MTVLILLSATVGFLMDKVMTVHITTEMYVSPEKMEIWEMWNEFCGKFLVASFGV